MAILELEEHLLETRVGPRLVVSCTPSAPVLLGRADLERMREVFEPSPRDLEILEQLRARERPADVFVFQSQALDGGAGSWYFEKDLSEDETAELGFQIVRSHRFLNRGLVDAGISMGIGAAKGYRELTALRAGGQRLLEELAAQARDASGPDKLRIEADLYLVRHLMVFTSLNLPSLLRGVIPDKLPLCERRATTFRELRQQASDLTAG